MKGRERDRLIAELVDSNGCRNVEELLHQLEYGTSGDSSVCRACLETCRLEPDVMNGLCLDCDEYAVISIYCLLEMI